MKGVRSVETWWKTPTSPWIAKKHGQPSIVLGQTMSPLPWSLLRSTSAYGLQQVHNADDLCITTQHSDFQHVEQTLELALDEMSIYYSSNHLKPNSAKTQICCFHLRNRDAKRKLDVTWNGLELDHYPNPIYLGVTLDRTLSFKQHALNTKAKINTRNNLLRKLTNSRWGAHPATVRTCWHRSEWYMYIE